MLVIYLARLSLLGLLIPILHSSYTINTYLVKEIWLGENMSEKMHSLCQEGIAHGNRIEARINTHSLSHDSI